MLDLAEVIDGGLRDINITLRETLGSSPLFKVYVIKRKGSANLYLKWQDPATGNEKRKTTGTSDPNEASRLAAELQAEINRDFLESQKREVTKRKVDRTLRFKVLSRDGYRCQYCGRGVNDGVKLEVDHVHPFSKGGSDDMENLATACFDCNRGKGANLTSLEA